MKLVRKSRLKNNRNALAASRQHFDLEMLETRQMLASVSGLVIDSTVPSLTKPLSNVLITLTGSDGSFAQTRTNSSGAYKFNNLLTGRTYQLYEDDLVGYGGGQANVGTVTGSGTVHGTDGTAVQPDTITGIVIDSKDDAGVNYNFSDAKLVSPATGAPVPNTSITGNFNTTTINAGSNVWLTAVMKVSNLPATGGTIVFVNQTIKFWAGTTQYVLPGFDSRVHFVPGLKTATTNFVNGEVVTYVPTKFSGNVLLAAKAFTPTVNLTGIKNVTWSGALATNAATLGVSVSWQWSAAVYSVPFYDYNTLGVKAADDSTLGPYLNADRAGTPETAKQYVIPGGTGLGLTNYTGNLTSVAKLVAELCGLC